MSVIDFYEAVAKRNEPQNASQWVDANGYESTVFIGGQPKSARDLSPEEFERLKSILACIPEFQGMKVDSAVCWVDFDSYKTLDTVCVFHEVFGCAELSSPLLFPGPSDGREVGLVTASVDGGVA